MTTKGKRPMRALTPGDKIEAIQRVNDGESKASVARDIGVPESTLRGWCKNEDKLRYMTSRLSSPDTDKSNDGEPLEKRARTESPAAPPAAPPSPPSGLDLTSATLAHPAHTGPQRTPDAPVELTTKRGDPSPPLHPPRDRRPDPGASVSMSAISPLSGLPHLPGLSHSHLGLSFNEIATNLTLLAQLNPGLSTLSAQPGSRALRSVRSPKPVHNGVLNLNENKHRSKSNHSSDIYRHSSSKSHHGSTHSSSSHPVDDTLWYWIKTHQAMFDFSAQTAAAHPLQLGKAAEPTLPPKPVAPVPPVNPHLDFNRNAWLWQYCKQIGGAMPLPEDKHKSASQVPKDKSADNILYSHLTKGKPEDDRSQTTSPLQDTSPNKPTPEAREPAHTEQRVAAPVPSPETAAENKEVSPEKPSDPGRTPSKVRNVLDNLLFNNNNNNQIVSEEAKCNGSAGGEWDAGTGAALEHGEKFLAWLEASGDPSVTRTHVHQLRMLLHNLRARRTSAPAVTSVTSVPGVTNVTSAPAIPADGVRRK